MKLSVKTFLILWESPVFVSIDDIAKHLSLPIQTVSGFAERFRIQNVGIRKLPLYSPHSKPERITFLD